MRVTSSCLIAALVVGLTAAPAAADTPATRLVVGLAAGADPAAVVAVLGDQASGLKPVQGLDAITIDVPTAGAATARATLAADPAVRYAERDGLVRADADPNEATNRSQGLLNQIPPAWTWSTGSPSVTVAVVDSGVSANGDLGSDRLAPGYDFVDGDDDPADDDNHGTLVATTIAAQHGNGVGGVGVCGRCRIMPVRVLSHSTTGTAAGYTSAVAAGIVWAAGHGAHIINLSLSTGTRSRVLEDAVARASADGALVVASAGDDSSIAPHYPAAIEPVLAVGSAGIGGLPLNASNRNPERDRWVDVSAYRTYAALNAQSQTQVLAGTSASAALVSGVAALGLSVKPGLSAADLRSAVLASAGRESTMDPADPPVLDAAGLLSDLGGTDDLAPRIDTAGSGYVPLVTGRTYYPSLIIVDDHAIRRSELEVEGTVVRQDHAWSGQSLKLTPPAGWNGRLSYKVRVYDYAGNSAEQTRAVRVDSIAPTGTIDAPLEGALVRGGPVDVVFTATADDVVRVQANETALTPTGERQWTGQVTLIADQKIYFDVYDRAGNITGLTRTLVVDDVAPTGVIDEPLSGRHVRGAVDVHFSQTSRETLRSVRVNGVPMTNVGVWGWQARIVPPASGDIEVVAEDLAGNEVRVKNRVVVDNDGPTATAVSPASGTKVRGTFTTGLSGVADVSGVTRAELWWNGKYVDVDRTAPYALPVKTGTFSGNVNLSWRLSDKLGNTRTYTRTVVADNKAPAVSITKAPKNKAKVKGTVKVSVKATDTSGIARVELLVNGKVVAKDTASAYLLSFNSKKQPKTMKVRIRAYDKLGNVAYTTTRTWYRS
ncbi:S8 family serine peptidase [Actinoplanes sp. NPDC049668]|uniref:S8 family serine peptidase n=1 Tax=unclassified Actinoplanes TaxID=2626549 RepID=UPI00339FCE9D